MKNKKARFVETFILVMGIALISLILLFVFQNKLFKGIDEDSLITYCRQSVAVKGAGNSLYDVANSQGIDILITTLTISDLTGEDVIPMDIKCFTQEKTIKESDEIKIKRALAEEMRDCYFQFWQGEKNPFGSAPRKYCFLCNIISFKEDNLIIDDFPHYIKNIKSFKDPQSYYLDYFNNCQTLGCSHSQSSDILQGIFPAGGEDYEIDTSKKYVIAYMYEKEVDDYSSTIAIYAEDELTNPSINGVGCVVNPILN